LLLEVGAIEGLVSELLPTVGATRANFYARVIVLILLLHWIRHRVTPFEI
jgi:hypothetical protein